MIDKVVKYLKDSGFVTDVLGHVTSESSHGSSTFMGVCKLSSAHLHRRLDIKVYPRE